MFGKAMSTGYYIHTRTFKERHRSCGIEMIIFLVQKVFQVRLGNIWYNFLLIIFAKVYLNCNWFIFCCSPPFLSWTATSMNIDDDLFKYINGRSSYAVKTLLSIKEIWGRLKYSSKIFQLNKLENPIFVILLQAPRAQPQKRRWFFWSNFIHAKDAIYGSSASTYTIFIYIWNKNHCVLSLHNIMYFFPIKFMESTLQRYSHTRYGLCDIGFIKFSSEL